LDKLLNCTACPLHKTRKKVVLPHIVSNPKAFIIGEAPGADEEERGEPFVGRAGKRLNVLLKGPGWTRDDVNIANVVCCRPPNNRKPHKKEREACYQWLKQYLSRYPSIPRILLGDVAAKAFDYPYSLMESHGIPLDISSDASILPVEPSVLAQQYQSTYDMLFPVAENNDSAKIKAKSALGHVVLMYHPAAVLHNPTNALKRILANDWTRLKDRLLVPARPPIIEFSTITDMKQLLKMYRVLRRQSIFSIDLETQWSDPYQHPIIALSISCGKANYFIPCYEEDHLNLKSILSTLQPLLFDNSIEKIFHNASFDVKFLYHYGIRVRRIIDTQIMAFFQNKRPLSLKVLALRELNAILIRRNNLLRKEDMLDAARQSPKAFAYYSAADSWATLQLCLKLRGRDSYKSSNDKREVVSGSQTRK
jgi:DNA polymerase